MNEREMFLYLGFDRFLQVQGTKYEQELGILEKEYLDKKINIKTFNLNFNKLIDNVNKERSKK